MTELLERGAARAARAGRAEGGRLVFVGGEAGVGKTSLVRAFAAASAGALRGSCENLTTPTPFGPVPRPRHRPRHRPAPRRDEPLLRELERAPLARARGRALGRPGDARRSARARPPHRLDRRSSSRPTATTRSARPSAAGRPRRARVGAAVDAARGAAALARRRARARRALRRRRGGDPPADQATRSTSPRCWRPARRRCPPTVRDAVLARAAPFDRRCAAAARGRVASCPAESSSGCSRRSRRTSSTHSTRASRRACCARTATASPSGTSSRGSRSRAPSRPTGAARCTPRSSRALVRTRRRLAARPPRRGGRRLGGGAASTPGRGAQRAAAAGAHREAAAQYARALRHAGALAPARARGALGGVRRSEAS